MAGIWEALTGKPATQERISKLTPDQEGALSQLLQFALPQLTSNQFDFGPIEEQARAGFAEKTVPSIAERFTSMGEGAQRGSGFAQTLGSAGAGLERDLASMKQQFGQQQQSNLMNMLNMGLTPQFDTMYNQPTGGFFGGMAPGFGAGFGESFGKAVPGMIGAGLGTLFGGPVGGAVGGAAGDVGSSWLQKLLSFFSRGQGA